MHRRHTSRRVRSTDPIGRDWGSGDTAYQELGIHIPAQPRASSALGTSAPARAAEPNRQPTQEHRAQRPHHAHAALPQASERPRAHAGAHGALQSLERHAASSRVLASCGSAKEPADENGWRRCSFTATVSAADTQYTSWPAAAESWTASNALAC